MSQNAWDREAWIEAYRAERPNATIEGELPTPEKEEAIAAEAEKAIAEGQRYANAPELGWRAYDATEKRCFYAHGHWIAEFLASRGLAHPPYRGPGARFASELVALIPEYEDGPGRSE